MLFQSLSDKPRPKIIPAKDSLMPCTGKNIESTNTPVNDFQMLEGLACGFRTRALSVFHLPDTIATLRDMF
jgi:hypothetical protein